MNEKHRFPPLELLKSTHTFPGPYTFKVIGENQNSFPERVVEAALMAVPDCDPIHTIRETDSGKHMAVTLEVKAESAEKVVRIYEELVKLSGTVLVL
jgi:putative lipoic acid-binding regulatory protein